MVKVVPVNKHTIVKKRTKKFRRWQSHQFKRVPVRRGLLATLRSLAPAAAPHAPQRSPAALPMPPTRASPCTPASATRRRL